MRNHYQRLYLAGLLIALVAGLSLMLLSGCSKNGVSVPLNDEALTQEKLSYLNTFFAPGGPQLGIPLDSCPVLIDTTIAAPITAKGGLLELRTDEDNLIFSIPAGALPKEALITIHLTKYKASFGLFWLLNCGPDGTVFGKPLEVTNNGSTSNTKILFYYNEKSQQWEVEEVAGNNESLSINHFSKYAISE